jgi:hypothetical protein
MSFVVCRWARRRSVRGQAVPYCIARTGYPSSVLEVDDHRSPPSSCPVGVQELGSYSLRQVPAPVQSSPVHVQYRPDWLHVPWTVDRRPLTMGAGGQGGISSGENRNPEELIHWCRINGPTSLARRCRMPSVIGGRYDGDGRGSVSSGEGASPRWLGAVDWSCSSRYCPLHRLSPNRPISHH